MFTQWHRDHGIDTLFFGEKSAQPCGSQTPGNVIAGELAPQYGFYCLTDINIPPQSIKNTSNVLATFLSDEPDNKVSDGLVKYPSTHENVSPEFYEMLNPNHYALQFLYSLNTNTVLNRLYVLFLCKTCQRNCIGLRIPLHSC